MRLSRRRLLLAGTLLAFHQSLKAWPQANERPANSPLRILILGGTGFLGPYQVRAALSRGHKVTLFNRGISGAGMFASEVEQLIGDRSGDLSALRGRTWDAVIDNCRSNPDWVERSANLLAPAVGHYLYVSSISAYADPSLVGLKESSPLAVLPAGADPEAPGSYGGAKAECEARTRSAFPDRFTIVRPSLIAGPGDPSDRFTYWPWRVRRGGEILAPGHPGDPIQYIDARDLADWMIAAAEGPTFGIFNMAGPASLTGMGQFLEAVKAVCGDGAVFTWVEARFLEKRGIVPWSQLPLWVPPGSAAGGFTRIDNSKALATGLRLRPLQESIRDVLAWALADARIQAGELRAGLSSSEESKLLQEWSKLELWR